MNISTDIDDKLINQASELTGLSDNRNLLEYALRLLIKAKEDDNVLQATSVLDKSPFYKQLQRYRADINLQQFTDIDIVFSHVRDTSIGRNVEL